MLHLVVGRVVVEHGVAEHGDDEEEELVDGRCCRAPVLVAEDVQRHLPFRADVGVVHLRMMDGTVRDRWID